MKPQVYNAELLKRLPLDDLIYKDPMVGCHIWLGGTTENGYGRLRQVYRDAKVHHVFFGKRAEPGKVIAHRCGVKLCCNPAHLYEGTAADNAADEIRFGKTHKGERNVKAKLTETQVTAIRASSLPDKQLAKLYEVNRTTISSIRRNLIWKHI